MFWKVGDNRGKGKIGFDCSVISGTLEGGGRFLMFREIWNNGAKLDLIVL